MKKSATVQEALQKACIYKKKPQIPKKIAEQFKGCTHCEIRAYHQRIRHKKKGGKTKKSRRVHGFIFIFLVLDSGDVIDRPVRILHKNNLTRRNFVTFAQKLTDNTDQVLLHALSN